MKVRFNRTGSKRKELVNAIGDILETRPVYKGAPTFNYNIGGFEVDKEGTLIIDECTDSKVVGHLLDELVSRGFTFDGEEIMPQDNADGHGELVIEMPIEGFTDAAIINLKRILEGKGSLIKKALGVDSLVIEQTEETLCFPWFGFNSTADEVKAYTHFISSLCEMAKTQQRITASQKDVENEKYAFRCFLLRLGFIGSEYKNERKILLSKLTGSSAFKSGTPKQEGDADE